MNGKRDVTSYIRQIKICDEALTGPAIKSDDLRGPTLNLIAEFQKSKMMEN